MKKLIFFITYVVLIFNIHAQSIQTPIDYIQIKCTYSYTYQVDSTNLSSKKYENMVLLIGKSISLFQSLNTMKRDSIRLILKREAKEKGEGYVLSQLSSIPKSNFNYKIYKNYPENHLTIVDNILKNKYIYQEQNPILHWNIMPAKKSIGMYSCQKATTSFAGRMYEAWFTTDVPISEGPYKFSGLPGLIVAIEDTQHFFSFRLTSLVPIKTQEPIIITKEKTIATTRNEFDKGVKYFKDNFYEASEAQGIKFDRKNTGLQQMLEKEKKTLNNFIEKN